MSNEMSTGSFYLVLKEKGWRGLGARLTTNQPDVSSNERVLKLQVTLPKAIFQTPTLEAKVIIPEDAVSKPLIDASVIDNVREVIQQQTGMAVTISVVEPTKVVEAVS